MAFQPLPGLPCVTDGFAKQLLLTLLPHTSRFSMPWLVKKKWEIKKRAKGQQRKQANIMPGLSSSVQTLGIMASHRLLWRAGDVVSISLSRLLVTQMQSNFKCCHGGTVALALQNTYRIIQEKKSFPSLFLLFLSTHQVNWGKLYFNLSKKKKGEKVITPLLLLTRPSLCHSQLKPVFYTRNSERSPAPPLPNFTFASLALFLNQATRKHKDGFSDRIIMDGIVKKKKKKKRCSLAWIITEDEESPSWDLFSVVVRTGGRDSLSIKSDRKCLSFFIQKGFCISKCVAPVQWNQRLQAPNVALQLCARTCKAFQPFTQFISLSNKSSQAFLSKASLLVKEWRTASFDSARKGKKPNGGASFISRWH